MSWIIYNSDGSDHIKLPCGSLIMRETGIKTRVRMDIKDRAGTIWYP